MLHCAEARVVGAFNALGESQPFVQFTQAAQSVAAFQGQVVSAPEDWLCAQGVAYWAGPESLPLWVPGKTHRGFGHRDTRRAVATGLKCRPLADTLRDTLAWELARNPQPISRKAGLGDELERELLRLRAIGVA